MSANNKEAAEREAFEAACIEAGYHKPQRGSFADSDYIYERDIDMFAGWMLARSALTASEAPATEQAPDGAQKAQNQLGSRASAEAGVVPEQVLLTPKEVWWAGYRAGKGLPPDTPSQDAIMSEQAPAGEVPYLIYYDDRGMPVEMVIGSHRAQERFRQISSQWNAHLFVKIKSNSRDDPYYHMNAALSTTPAVPSNDGNDYQRENPTAYVHESVVRKIINWRNSLQESLREIATAKNGTATDAQFARELQWMAADAVGLPRDEVGK